MSRGPVPTQLCLLSSVPDRSIGDKVRFLGCVDNYDAAKASLVVGHGYPRGSRAMVSVNVELLLDTLDGSLTRGGEWVNVMGYVTANRASLAKDGNKEGAACAKVQALLLWATGPLDVRQYEKAFEI